MVSHDAGPLNSKPRAWVAAAGPAFGEALQLRIVGGHVHFHRDELVAALAVLGRKTAAFEAQYLARGRALGDAQHHRSFRRGHLHLGAEYRLLERDRQLEPDVGAVAREEAMLGDLDGD